MPRVRRDERMFLRHATEVERPSEGPRFPPFSIEVDPEVEKLGVQARFFVVRGLSPIDENDATFQAWRTDMARRLRTPNEHAPGRAQALFDLQVKRFNLSADQYRPAPIELLAFLGRNKGKLPKIPHGGQRIAHPLVDAYNAVSALTGFALGAHDITPQPAERHPTIHGPLRLRMTTGDERFCSLSKGYEIAVPAGVYAYVDDGADTRPNVLCLLVHEQGWNSRVTPDTRDALLIIQGAEPVSPEELNAAEHLLGNHLQYLYGQGTVLQPVETSPFLK